MTGIEIVVIVVAAAVIVVAIDVLKAFEEKVMVVRSKNSTEVSVVRYNDRSVLLKVVISVVIVIVQNNTHSRIHYILVTAPSYYDKSTEQACNGL